MADAALIFVVTSWLFISIEEQPILLLAGAAYWTYDAPGAVAGVIFSTLALICLPASTSILGIECNILKAANALAWAAMFRGLSPLYPVLLAVILVYAPVLIVLARMDVWLSLQIAAGLFSVLSVFSALGGAFYERRDNVDIQTWVSPEQEAEKQRKRHHANREMTTDPTFHPKTAGSTLQIAQRSWRRPIQACSHSHQ